MGKLVWIICKSALPWPVQARQNLKRRKKTHPPCPFSSHMSMERRSQKKMPGVRNNLFFFLFFYLFLSIYLFLFFISNQLEQSEQFYIDVQCLVCIQRKFIVILWKVLTTSKEDL